MCNNIIVKTKKRRGGEHTKKITYFSNNKGTVYIEHKENGEVLIYLIVGKTIEEYNFKLKD